MEQIVAQQMSVANVWRHGDRDWDIPGQRRGKGKTVSSAGALYRHLDVHAWTLDLRCRREQRRSALGRAGAVCCGDWCEVGKEIRGRGGETFLRSSGLLATSGLAPRARRSRMASEARVLTLENAWNQAVQQKDTPALKMLLGSELIYIEYDGKLMGKAEYLASVQSALLRPAQDCERVHGCTSLRSGCRGQGVYRESGAAKDGKPYALRERFTDTWVRRSDSWVCVSSQSTLATH